MAVWYKYAVLRICPDEVRGETVNVGLFTLSPEGKIALHIPERMNKASALDDKCDRAFIYSAANTIFELTALAETAQQKTEIISSSFHGALQSSPLAEFMAHDQKDYNRKVKQITDLLITPRISKHREMAPRITTRLKNIFDDSGLLAESGDINEHRIVAQYPIDEKTGLKADFALKNSVMHITQTIDFNVKSQTGKVQEAALDAIKLDMATRTFGKDTAKYVVYSAKRSSQPVKQALGILEQHTEMLFNMESSQDKQEYLSILENAASH